MEITKNRVVINASQTSLLYTTNSTGSYPQKGNVCIGAVKPTVFGVSENTEILEDRTLQEFKECMLVNCTELILILNELHLSKSIVDVDLSKEYESFHLLLQGIKDATFID